MTPTQTPLPTATSVDCDRLAFVSDITVPDGSIFTPGEPFVKSWRLKNDGTCNWTTDYRVIFIDGDNLGAPNSFTLPRSVPPGETIDINIWMRAPKEPGTYRSNFKLQTDSGVTFGEDKNKEKPFWLEINVQPSIVRFDFVDRSCFARWFSGSGDLSCSGNEGDPRGFVRRISNPALEDGTVSSMPALLTHPQIINNGYISGVFPPYRVQKGDRFQSIVSCEAGSPDCYVVFQLDYQIEGKPVQTFWSFVEQYDGISYQSDIDLSALAGQDVQFILSVFAVGSADEDRAIWTAPRILYQYPVPVTRNHSFFLDR